MAEYYIGSRSTWDEVNTIAGSDVRKLNNRMSEVVRSAAMKMGIKKTQAGKQIQFYAVTKQQLDNMITPAAATWAMLKDSIEFRPLITVDGQKLVTAITEVAGKYPARMDYATHAKYNRDIIKAVEDCIYKVNEDQKIERPKHTNPGYKVGDIITHRYGYRETVPAIITKITNAGYQYQIYTPNFHVPRSSDVADWASRFVDGEGQGNEWDGSVSIPFLANKERFTLQPKKFNKRFGEYNRVMDKDRTDASYMNYWYMD